MSNLGSYGSSDFASEASTPIANASGATALPSSEQSMQDVSELFKSVNFTDHIEALKILLILISKGTDVSDFAPLVVQQVASQDPNARQLAYIYLNHYADVANDTIVMSVNTFQRTLTDSDPICRALAVKVMSSIRSREILPAVQEAITQVIGDPSPYVKKAAAYAMIKASDLISNPDDLLPFLNLLSRLLGDSSPIAFSGAIAAYWSLCPDNVELIHPHFRNICQNISKLDPWAQYFTLRALTVYCRHCFRNPEHADPEQDSSMFWDDSPMNSLSADHLLLIHTAKKLLSSPNSAVATAATSLLFYCAPSSHISSVARPLVRLLYLSPLQSVLSITTILTIASAHPHVFVPQLPHFFIRSTDSQQARALKLRVLSLLSSPSNATAILTELSRYSGSADLSFAALSVRAMGSTALHSPGSIPACLISLLKLLTRSEGIVLAEVVKVISLILRQRRGTEDESAALRQLCRKFPVVTDPSARASVLSIVGDMHSVDSEFAPSLLRYVAQRFAEESTAVRLQALTLAAKMIAVGECQEIAMYVLKIGERDNEFDVRDRAQFLLAIVCSQCEEIKTHIKELLFPQRRESLIDDENGNDQFQIGTFSHFFNRALDGYEAIPDWEDEDKLPDDSVRNSAEDGTDDRRNERENMNIESFFSDRDEEEEYEYEEEEEEEEDNANDKFFN